MNPLYITNYASTPNVILLHKVIIIHNQMIWQGTCCNYFDKPSQLKSFTVNDNSVLWCDSYWITELLHAISAIYVTLQLHIHHCINWLWSVSDHIMEGGSQLTSMMPAHLSLLLNTGRGTCMKMNSLDGLWFGLDTEHALCCYMYLLFIYSFNDLHSISTDYCSTTSWC